MKVVSLCNSSVPWAMALGGGWGEGGISGILGGGVFKPGAPLKSIPILRPGL